jgi:hypothetical protein
MGRGRSAPDGSRPATVDDIQEIARALPGVNLADGSPTVYQVSRRSFLFFRNPRPDAVDPDTGERYTDVIVFWVESDLEKEASWPMRPCRSSRRRTSTATRQSWSALHASVS